MLPTRLLLQFVLATAVSANFRHLLKHRQSECTGSSSDRVCTQSTSLADCRDAICADPCYLDVPQIQECCNTASTSQFSQCLEAQLSALGGSSPTSFTPSQPLGTGVSSSLPRYLTDSATPTQPASITAAPTAGSGSGSGSDACDVVLSAIDTCASAINDFDNLPAVSQGSCYCSAAGPDVFDSALDGCVRTGTISVPNGSALMSIAPTFCFEIGAEASPTGVAGGAGNNPIPTTVRPGVVSTPSSFTPADVATTPIVVISTLVVGNTQSSRTTGAARSSNTAQGGAQTAAGGAQSATGGASFGSAPADLLSVLTAMVLAILGA